MRIRIVIPGIAAGAICLFALWFPFYVLEPSKIVADWPYAAQTALFPAWFPTAVIVLCGVTVFAAGWISARWNWSGNWRLSALAGAGTGLIAGCLIYDFIGTFYFGMKGQQEILKSFYQPVSKTEGMKILIDGLTQTASLLYLNFIVTLSAAASCGALGGLASAIDVKDFWGRSPRNPEGWLFRLPAYSLVVTGCLNLIVTIAALQVLSEKTTEAAVQSNYQGSRVLPPVMILILGYFIGLAMTVLPASLTWGWVLRGWRKAGPGRILSAAWLLLTFGAASYYVLYQVVVNSMMVGIPQAAVVVIGILLIGILVGFAAEEKGLQDPSYRFSDWLGYWLTQGILGGTQIVMGVMAYAFSLSLIAVVNIPHLVASGPVEQTPADQLMFLYGMLSTSAEAAIVGSLVGGLITGALVLLLRTLFGAKALEKVGSEAISLGDP